MFRKIHSLINRWCIGLVGTMVVLTGCEKSGEKGSISISLDPVVLQQTRISEEIPETGMFLLTVLNAKGKAVFDGRFGDMPEKILVQPGSYHISIRSREFRKPAFSAPQYGDDQLVVVPSGGHVEVLLKCVMVNAGIRLRMGSDFLENYPDAVVFIESSGGRLVYNHTERRVACFPAGPVTVYMDEYGKRTDLFTRVLEKREILDIKLIAPDKHPAGEEISVVLDTTKFWITEKFPIGGNSGGGGDHGEIGGGEVRDAMSVGMARNAVGKKGVWVYGYIVGCMNGSHLFVEEPFNISSNIVIASNKFIDDRSSCLALELRKAAVRAALNLEEHPELLGRKVYVRGDIVASYYGDAGMKGIDDFRL